MSGWKFEHAVTCNANRSFVWSFWTDVSNWERLEGKAVEWITLQGHFEVGTSGVTKAPGQDPQQWKIVQLDPKHSATIEMHLDGAVFSNVMFFESVSPECTLIKQRMGLTGAKAPDFAKGMRIFEINAPQGLAKLAEAIEAAYKVLPS